MIAKNPRNSIIRRVHWNRFGYPVLDMQEHQDIPEPLRKIQGTVELFNLKSKVGLPSFSAKKRGQNILPWKISEVYNQDI